MTESRSWRLKGNWKLHRIREKKMFLSEATMNERKRTERWVGIQTVLKNGHKNGGKQELFFSRNDFSQPECYASISLLLSEGNNEIGIQTATFSGSPIISSLFHIDSTSEWWNAPLRAKVQGRRGAPLTLALLAQTLIASFLRMQISLRRAMSRRTAHRYSGGERAGRKLRR